MFPCDATEILDGIRVKSCSIVVEEHIQRIKDLNPKYNAVVVTYFDSALQRAKMLDNLSKEDRGPLHGLPITIKLAFNMESWIVKRLSEAGCIILGQTNVPEGVTGQETINKVYGKTINPIDPERTCGGSSGGCAVAVRTGMAAFGFGSDAGGSILQPCHCCNIFGHRTTRGLLPLNGHEPSVDVKKETRVYESGLLTIGPLCRSARDLHLVMKTLCSPDHYHQRLPEKKRVAYFFEGPNLPKLTDGVQKVVEKFISCVRVREAHKVDRRSAYFTELRSLNEFFSAKNETITIEELFPVDEIEYFINMAVERWSASLKGKDQHSSESYYKKAETEFKQFWERYDIFLCPVLPFEAPFTTDNMEAFHLQEREKMTLQIDGEKRPYLEQVVYPLITGLYGFPATSCPIGYTDDGLAVNIQIVANTGYDWDTIHFADYLSRLAPT